MTDAFENLPADPATEAPVADKSILLQAAKADLKQAKAAVKAAKESASQAKKQVKSLKSDLKKSSAKKSRKTDPGSTGFFPA